MCRSRAITRGGTGRHQRGGLDIYGWVVRSQASTTLPRAPTALGASQPSLSYGRGITVGHNQVSLIMSRLGIQGLPKRRLPRGARLAKKLGAPSTGPLQSALIRWGGLESRTRHSARLLARDSRRTARRVDGRIAKLAGSALLVALTPAHFRGLQARECVSRPLPRILCASEGHFGARAQGLL